jgi:integrase
VPKLKMTVAALDRIKPPREGQVDYFDAAYPGLALRVTANGVRSWTYFGRVHGKLKRATIGRYPDLSLAKARVKAGETADAMRAGTDPTAAKRAARREPRDKDQFEIVAREWLMRDQKGNRSAAEVKRVIERDVLPALGRRKIQTITRRDIIDLVDGIVDRGAETMARRTHAYLHRLFRWAVGRDIIDVNPVADLPKPGAETARDRFLTDTELRELWKAASATDWPFGPALKLLILTGARRDEISALRWKELNIADAVIRLEGARTKNGQPHEIALSEPALEIAKALPKIGNSEFVFTTTGKTPISGWSRAKAAIDEQLEAFPLFRLHDLRRTVATGMQRLGVRLEAIEAVLGHVSGSRRGVVGVYQRHSFADEARAALIAWGDHVVKVVGGKPAKVVKLRPRAK